MDNIRAFCECNGIDSLSPNDLNAPFVVTFYIAAPEIANTVDSKFRVAVITRRLFSAIPDGAMVQINTKYKVSWQGYPLFVTKFSDRGRHFHNLLLGNCSRKLMKTFNSLPLSMTLSKVLKLVNICCNQYSAQIIMYTHSPTTYNCFIHVILRDGQMESN